MPKKKKTRRRATCAQARKAEPSADPRLADRVTRALASVGVAVTDDQVRELTRSARAQALLSLLVAGEIEIENAGDYLRMATAAKALDDLESRASAAARGVGQRLEIAINGVDLTRLELGANRETDGDADDE